MKIIFQEGKLTVTRSMVDSTLTFHYNRLPILKCSEQSARNLANTIIREFRVEISDEQIEKWTKGEANGKNKD